MRSGRGILYRKNIWGSSGGEESAGAKSYVDTIKPKSGTRLASQAPASFFCFCGLEKANIGNEPV